MSTLSSLTLSKKRLKCVKINKKMGWCNDKKDSANYNKLINTKKKIRHEKLYRKDFKYNMIIPIKYNWIRCFRSLAYFVKPLAAKYDSL